MLMASNLLDPFASEIRQHRSQLVVSIQRADIVTPSNTLAVDEDIRNGTTVSGVGQDGLEFLP